MMYSEVGTLNANFIHKNKKKKKPSKTWIVKSNVSNSFADFSSLKVSIWDVDFSIVEVDIWDADFSIVEVDIQDADFNAV